MLGKDDRLGAEVRELPELLPVGFLAVPSERQLSCTCDDLLGKGHDYRFVVAASKLFTDISFFYNLLNVVCGYGSI